jgi:hypothetical protein
MRVRGEENPERTSRTISCSCILGARRRMMPRFVIERTFPDGLHIPISADGAAATAEVGRVNASEGVNWVHSYVSGDKKRSYCVYDAPDSAAIERAAEKNGLPIEKITEVSVLTPSFYY